MSPAVAAIIAAVAVVAVLVVVVLLMRGRRSGEPAAEQIPDDAGPKPAGWYADPIDDTQVRWWDGSAWTDHLQDKPEA